MNYSADFIRSLHNQRRQLYSERDMRLRRVRDALRGVINADLHRLGNKEKDPAIANLIAPTTRTIAQRVGIPPRLHGTSTTTQRGGKDSDRAKKRIERHEAAISQRLEAQHFAQLLPQGAYWLAPTGFLPLVLVHDPALGHSRIRIRDPLSCYPSTVWPHEPGVEDCIFTYKLTPAQLKVAFPNYALSIDEEGTDLTVAEYHSAGPTVVAVIEPECRIVEEIENPTGECNVWVARDLTSDFDFYGQFDQVVPIMEAEARLLALVEAYAEQQVAAETNVVGEITSNGGNYAVGLGAVNTIEPSPGVSVSKVNNNMSPQVFQYLANLERAQRLTGNMPLGLSGESDLSFATGRGIEKLNASVDDNVGHYQNILGLALHEVINAIPAFEAAHEVPNPGFAPDVRIQLQFMSGADPAVTVRQLQLVGVKALSRRTLMDNTPEVADPEQEDAQIAKEALREALLADVLGKAQQGAADPKLIVALAKNVGGSKTLEEALEDYYKELEEAAANAPAPVAPPGGGEAVTSLDALMGLSPQGEAVGGTMARAEVA